MGFFNFFKRKDSKSDKINKLQEPLRIALSYLEKKRNNATRGIMIDLSFDEDMIEKINIAQLIKQGHYNTWGREFIEALLDILNSIEIKLDEVNHLIKYIENELSKLENLKGK
jgi:hypothetical protein